MREISREWLEFLQEQYPRGSRIKLTEMRNDPQPIPPGTTGTLDYIDDAGQFHVRWDNGRSLALVIGEDRFTVLSPKPTLLKLYMPLTAEFYERDEWGDMPEGGEPWDGRSLLDYEDSILSAMFKERLPEEAERGIMHWYHKNDSVNDKVRSAVFTAEERAGQLWGVAECQVVGELSPKELADLKAYICGQASDGWGEGFEQREIRVDGGELYVHLWNSDSQWNIQTEEEQFGSKPAEGLPDYCYSTLPADGSLILIKRGEAGYHFSSKDAGSREANEQLAEKLNDALCITFSQEKAMNIGATLGWDNIGADPAMWKEQEKKYYEDQQAGEMTFK